MEQLQKSLINHELTFIESINSIEYDMMDDDFIYESVVLKIKDELTKFFTKLTSSMKYFYKSIRNDVKAAIEEKNIIKTLKEDKERIIKNHDRDNTYYSVFDIQKFNKTYYKHIKKLDAVLNSIVDKKYKTRDELERTMRKFDDLLYKADYELSEITKEKTVDMTSSEYLNYIDDCISGRCTIYKDYVRHVHYINDLGLKAEKIFKDISVMSDDDVLKQKWTCIRKCSTKLTTKLNKWVTKFIMGCVFMFA